MNEQIKELIHSIASGSAAETQDLLGSIMTQKMSAALADMRIEVSQNMFQEQE